MQKSEGHIFSLVGNYNKHLKLKINKGQFGERKTEVCRERRKRE